jgi:FtsP/CotA-like multicopper oxidase with cupredoxin domain
MGDVILVNGVPWPNMPVEQRVYRFRMLNASISRSYRPQLSTGDPVHIVATDGGLMPLTQTVKNWRHGNAERYEVLIDFSRYPVGTRIVLQNLSNKNNIDYDSTNKIMQFTVVGPALDPRWNTVTNPKAIPVTPNPDNWVMKLNAADAVKTRRFAVDRSNGLWQFGEHTWEDVINTNYQFSLADVAPDSTEIWEITNNSGGWFHPVHIHLVDFKILSRNGAPPFPYERGPKDVVYIGEGESVRLLMQFKYQTGRYMIHCHNLVHEDHDMMGQFRVGADTPDNDPMGFRAKPNGVDEL